MNLGIARKPFEQSTTRRKPLDRAADGTTEDGRYDVERARGESQRVREVERRRMLERRGREVEGSLPRVTCC